MADDKKEFVAVTDDMLLDDISDLPSFAPWPTGAYHIRLDDGITSKDVELKSEDGTPNGQIMRMKEMEATLVTDPEEIAAKTGDVIPKAGAKTQFRFNMDNEYGAGEFKIVASVIAKALSFKTVGEVCEGSKGVELIITVKQETTTSKKNGKEYTNSRIRQAFVV